MAERNPVSTSRTSTGILAELPVTRESTTSRVLVENDLLRVVYFSFDSGQQLTEHSSPRAVVVSLLSGSMDFTVGAGAAPTRLSPGDVVYLAPHEPHALVALEPCHMSLVMVDPEAAPD